MASGSTGRANSGSKGFDFATDDILCSYDDYVNPDSNGNQSDSAIGSGSSKDFLKSRMARSSKFPAPAYSPPEDSLSQDLISTVEITMKKHTDGLMRFLEGISSRLSQLELCCYNLDKSVQEMRSELVQDRDEADSKLKYLEKHVQEVHRSVQILRDKQELAETQKELAKLQLVQKESSSSSHHSQSNDERASPAPPDSKKNENTSEVHNRQLALALPHQVAPPPPQQQPVAPPPSQPPPQQSYYIPSTQLPNPQPQAPPSQQPQAPPSQQPQAQYMAMPPAPQEPETSRMAPQPRPSQVNAMQPSVHSFPPQYQQQWPQQQHQQQQQLPPPQQQVQPPAQNPQNRAPPAPVYASYTPTQPTPPPQEMVPNSMPMQVPYSGVPQPVSSRPTDVTPYGYNTPIRTTPPPPQQAPPQQIKGGYGAPSPGDGYAPPSGTLPQLPPGSAYMMYDNDGGRPHPSQQQPHFAQSGYHPSPNMPPQNLNLPPRNPSHAQFFRNHPHGELIEKLVSMGFRGDHAASVIQRMEESGQQVDFNSVLDRLDMHSSGGPPRGWSG